MATKMPCFITNCNNTLGEEIPKDNRKKVWLERLNLGYIPPESIICHGHIKHYNLLTTPPKSAKTDANQSISQINYLNAKRMCRICMSPKNLVKKISDPLEGEILIMSVIMLTCYPVQFSEDDSLPKDICSVCLKDLIIAHKLRLRCLDSLKKIPQRMEAIQELKRKIVDESNPDKKIKFDEAVEESIENIKKEINSDGIDSNYKNIGHSNVSTSDLINTLCENNVNTINSNVILPKSIKLKALIKYQSEIGTFPCTLEYGMFDNVFIKSQEFMYFYGLVKHDIKNLHCINPGCKALATQKIVGKDAYEACITVKVPHNHIKPNDDEQKRYIFYVILKKRMCEDKNVNIRNVYEEFCTLEPSLRDVFPLRQVITEFCKHHLKAPNVNSFQQFFDEIEPIYSNLHFTQSGNQFYQERFSTEDGGLAILFCNNDVADQLSDSLLMYVDASFQINCSDEVMFQLVTVLVWIEESYYPIVYALVNKNSRNLYKCIFAHLHDYCAPKLRPDEIVTDYDANLYYALGETYSDAQIGGSVFYYTQNIYTKVCALNLSHDLETNSFFRNIYHMLLMLPLLPNNTIIDGLKYIEILAKKHGLSALAKPLFAHVRAQWIAQVTTDLFCVHRQENRINENVIAPFKKLRDLFGSKGKGKNNANILLVVEKIIELESFLNDVYSKEDKKSFGRDLNNYQKRNVIKAWQFIDGHPKINIHNFSTKVLGYIKCMENQLWIWGFYRFMGNVNEELINANNFSIINMQHEQDDEYEEDAFQLDPKKLQFIANNAFSCIGESKSSSDDENAEINYNGNIIFLSNINTNVIEDNSMINSNEIVDANKQLHVFMQGDAKMEDNELEEEIKEDNQYLAPKMVANSKEVAVETLIDENGKETENLVDD